MSSVEAKGDVAAVSHDRQASGPVNGLNLPAEQGVHVCSNSPVVLSTAPEVYPLLHAHAEIFFDPAADHESGGQSWHCPFLTAPRDGRYFPAGHKEQAIEPLAFLYVP